MSKVVPWMPGEVKKRIERAEDVRKPFAWRFSGPHEGR